MHKACCIGAIVCAALAAAPAVAQTPTPDLGELSLQELLDVEVTSTASKFPQQVTDAPASITIVTSEEIRRYGHRMLSDVLRSVRGLYVSYDRNYSYLGVRGFGRPGDYNTRMLLLIDGHRLNDPIYDMGPIGTDLPLDIEMIDRVEIIRGPGSALYGTNAFFAVVNILTRSGRQEAGVRAAAEGGSLDTYRGRVSMGRVFGNGVELMLSGSLQDIDGANELYFAEFDAPETAHGVARGADDDGAGRLFGAVSLGAVTVRGAYAQRAKNVPTASFGTVFGDTRFRTRDEYAVADVAYTGAFGRGWTGSGRASYDRYQYDGRYPYDDGADGTAVLVDAGGSDWLTAEFTASRRLAPQHFLTVGSEARYAVRQEMYTADAVNTYRIDSRRSGTWGAYVQDEWSVTRNVVLSGGLRVDRSRSWGTEVTPRAAAVYSPLAGTALKLMHGRAFRAPNAYEMYYYSLDLLLIRSVDLTPETIQTTEVAWEQYYGRRVRSTVSLFRSDIDGLIAQTPAGDDGTWSFANLSGARSTGVEAEVEARWPGGFTARASHAFTRARDSERDGRLSNSPAHLAKASAIVPVATTGVFLGLEGAYTGRRRSVRHSDVAACYVQNLTISTERLIPRADVQVSIHNLFDHQYADPGAEEHVQAGIPQDGRTIRLRVGFRF